MDDYLNDPLLIAVVEQIKKDFVEHDETAIYELLSFLPKENLIAYLPEQLAAIFTKESTSNGNT